MLCLVSCTTSRDEHSVQGASEKPDRTAATQVPTWSRGDMNFFLHGSISTEVVPETVLRAFIRTYPDLFPSPNLSHLGLIPDPAFGWPVGFSRSAVAHLGGLSAVGVNCAVCHVGEVVAASGGERVRVLGMTSHFDAEGFFGAVTFATFRTADPANMKRFLAAYLAENDPPGGDRAQELLDKEWQQQEAKIVAVLTADPTGSKDIAPGALHPLAGTDLRFDRQRLASGTDLSSVAHSMLRLFHNMRAALHIPDQPPPPSPPNGPGRNDTWRLLAYSLLGIVTQPAPVKFGIVWNEDRRAWVHFDANTRSPIVRNLAAALGLGAPLLDHHGQLDFAALKRHTRLSEVIRPPRYPWAIALDAADRGARIYATRCASCHDGAATDERLHSTAEIRTDPNRADIFTTQIADQFNRFFADLQIPGYQPPQPPPLRSTQQYWASSLAGVWARSPYLHNGSVRSMQELLTPPPRRAKSFHRGSRIYDAAHLGYVDEGAYLLDTAGPGNANTGHNYGTDLSSEQKRELIEYLKTL
jgi:hypothetical protein